VRLDSGCEPRFLLSKPQRDERDGASKAALSGKQAENLCDGHLARISHGGRYDLEFMALRVL